MDDARERDSLTGLGGPALAREKLLAWQEGTAQGGQPAPVHAMLLGLGRFHTVNIAFGEASGDGALIEVTRRIQHFADDEFEHADWAVVRMGGGQFLILAHEACSRERWQWLGEALADAVAHPIADDAGGGSIRLWPRVALIRVLPGEGPDLIFDRLAETLDRAQQIRGRRVLWADGEWTVPGVRAAKVEADLLGALDRGEISVRYQPQFSFGDDRLYGAEALASWEHPSLGRIGGSTLFAIAERADHVAQLSRHIAAQALAGALHWPEGLRLSVNVTPADLAAASFADEFLALVRRSGFAARRLTVEITEQVLLGDLEQARISLGKLKDAGVRIALDDFGAGFCNFRYLKILPLDYIKLDRSMIDGVAEDQRDLEVLRGIIAMAKALGLDVIAEGIETEAQLEIVRSEGCSSWQGFLGGKAEGRAVFNERANTPL
ncbi:bifunctional diguanylate cyclase/phosphodiesterase [Erythrobacter sp. HKB08]|uniref:bifunctional diguanylate cyclase/phosphodiesterase n=1 Tax=Erythrobacter sp. HKB08 TaxID=2502843 RepID=UPI001F2E6A15|nr:bifunctional diguanylate cyclase/phosphodiesterase [Erythrobacter sp. HKB08]